MSRPMRPGQPKASQAVCDAAPDTSVLCSQFDPWIEMLTKNDDKMPTKEFANYPKVELKLIIIIHNLITLKFMPYIFYKLTLYLQKPFTV